MMSPIREPTDARERLARVVSMVRRTLRYWWLVLGFAIAGGSAAFAFDSMRAESYRSETVLMHHEIIPSRLLQGTNVGGDRNLATRLRDLVYSSELLIDVMDRHDLLAEDPGERARAAALEEMRVRLEFKDRGGGTFRIAYVGDTPERARAVTRDLAEALIEVEHELQQEGVAAMRDFLRGELERVEQELHDRELAVAAFLAEHPEFAEDVTTGLAGAQGAAIRARKKQVERDPTLIALERQRARIRSRLDGRPSAPAVSSPALAEANQELRRARAEVREQEAHLANMRRTYTARHPDVARARDRIDQAQRRVSRAQEKIAALTRVAVAQRAPASRDERDALRAKLNEVERAITMHRGMTPSSSPDDGVEDTVVSLETTWARLRRNVEEARDRYEVIESRGFMAEMVAASEISGGRAQLVVLDPASLPTRAAGSPRMLLVAAGSVAFAALGLGLALALAFGDDRLLGAADLRRFGLDDPLAVVPAPRR